MEETLNNDLLERQTEIFKALSNKTRLAIVNILYKQSRTVNEIVEILGDKERTGVSKHLNVLRSNSIVDYKEEGTSRVYFLKARCLINAVDCTLQMIE